MQIGKTIRSCQFQISQACFYKNLFFLKNVIDIISVKHEASLTEILLDKDKKYSEADFTVTLAEHLFKLLAPEQHYVIDKGARGKNSCKCKIDTCEKEKHFGNTRIGMIFW